MTGRNVGRWPALILGLALLAGASACAPWVRLEQPNADGGRQFELRDGDQVGQTFTAYFAGLTGLDVYAAPGEPGDGLLRLRLRAGPDSGEDLAQASLPLQSVSGPGFIRLNFDAQPGSLRRDYYAVLEIEGAGSLKLEAASAGAYLNGALYEAGRPVEAQMVFNLVYAPADSLLGLAGEAAGWVGWTLAGVAVFVLPGLALLAWLWPRSSPLDAVEWIGLAAGLSLALYPAAMLLTHLVGWQLGAGYAWGAVALSAGALVWRMTDGLRSPARLALPGDWRSAERLWPNLALWAVIVLVFGVRYWVIRTLDVPMWGDSVHHTMIAQLLVDNGGLFETWRPYADLDTFTYHFGFHATVAVFHWITGLTLPQAALWTGQLLNGLAVLVVAPLALRLCPNRWAAVGAVLVAGLLAPMPMYYVNWGRYTQLAGQVILPAAMLLAWRVLETADGRRRLLALAWLAWGGLALTHFRVLVMAVLFAALAWAAQVIRRNGRVATSGLMALGVGASLLFLPWFIRVFGGQILAVVAVQLSTPPSQISDFTREYNLIGPLTTYLPWPIWALMLLAFVWALWRRRWDAVLMGLWWGGLILLANPDWLGLPGVGVINNFAVFIASYLPAGAGVGLLLGEAGALRIGDPRLGAGWALGTKATAAIGQLWLPGLAGLCLLLGLWAARGRLADLRVNEHALLTRPDVRAMDWIRAHTDQDARFLVNSFFAYGGSSVVGSDAGWWLPLLTGRAATLPPITYSVEHNVSRADYREWINAVTAAVETQGVGAPATLALLRERGVTHVFIGQRRGGVGYVGPGPLDPWPMAAHPVFRVVYHEDQVWIFELVQ